MTAGPKAIRRLIPHLENRAWIFLAGGTINSVGTGLTLPFIIVYLHTVRHIPFDLAGGILAADGVVSFMSAPVAGWLVDRIGPARSFIIALLANGIITAAYALVHVAWQGFLVGCALGVVTPFLGSAWGTLLTELVPRESLNNIFGMSYAASNLGIGVGGIIGGLIVATSSPRSFVTIFVADGCSYLLYAVLLAVIVSRLRLNDRRAAAAADDDQGQGSTSGRAAGGYRAALADRRLLVITGAYFVLTLAGLSQMTSAFPLWAVGPAHSTARVVGIAFAADTFAVVGAQLFVLRLIRTWRRTRAAAAGGAIFGVAWLVAAAARADPGGVAAAVLLVAALCVFGLGETFVSASLAPLINDLAPDALRGRYNAVFGYGSQLGMTLGPVMAGFVFGAGLGSYYMIIIMVACLAAAGFCMRVSRVLPHVVDSGVPAESPSADQIQVIAAGNASDAESDRSSA